MPSCLNSVTALQQQRGCKLSLILKASDYEACQDSPLPVFRSLDLDVLRKEEWLTNWDQGSMSMQELQSILASIRAKREVLGMDICGGLSVSKGATEETLQTARLRRERFCDFLKEISLLQ